MSANEFTVILRRENGRLVRELPPTSRYSAKRQARLLLAKCDPTHRVFIRRPDGAESEITG